MSPSRDVAIAGGRVFTDLTDVTNDLAALDGSGMWVVVIPFDGPPVLARFRSARRYEGPRHRTSRPAWVSAGSWESSFDRNGYCDAVGSIRRAIGAGDVYQVNLCRRLSAPVPAGFDITALGDALAAANPAPYQAVVSLPSRGIHVASASPECFISRRGDIVESRPIKGTAPSVTGLSTKDRAENVMIVDLVRNDLGRVCEFGSVTVPALCAPEHHPGLVHLVSTVRGRLRPGAGWADVIGATFPPGSVTGAPKLAALDMISRLEPVSRSVYCGAVGWVDAGGQMGELNVAIRTFWVEGGQLHFGTGAGITWDSTPEGEWEETELKARRLLSVASGADVARLPGDRRAG